MKQPSFIETIEQALKHYQDPTWLGDSSPLASPYVLGNRLAGVAQTPLARGRVLQALLKEATGHIEGKNQERYQLIIREYYFHDRPVDFLCDRLGITKVPFFAARKAAIDALAETFTKLINPALRLETAPLTNNLLEREEQLAVCQAAIQRRQTIALMGDNGIGKTSIGAMAAQSASPVFWYTFHVGLNDRLDSLLFALGYFLHQHHISALWQEVVASPNALNYEKLAGLIRYCFSKLAENQKIDKKMAPLLCFDEIDLLKPATQLTHGPILEFLKSLRGQIAVILMGQQTFADADLYITLQGLTLAATRDLFIRNSCKLTLPELQQIHSQTAGNPQLLQLCVNFLKVHELDENLLQHLVLTPSVELLLSRVLQNLSETERGILMALSVYRNMAPIDLWQTRQTGAALRHLAALHLLQQDQSGGIAVVPVYRLVIYRALPDEKRRQLHHMAGAVRSRRGAYTAAAYHLIQAGEPERAIWLWREHRSDELAQGQAQAALTLLRSTVNLSLETTAREVLMELCAHLERFSGNLIRAQQDLHSLLYSTPILEVEAAELAGMVANDVSDFASAEHSFRQAIKVAEQLVEIRAAYAYKGLGWMYMRQQDVENAQRELEFANYEIENMRGNLREKSCDYAGAEQHFQLAMNLAEKVQHIEGMAKTALNLAGIYMRQGKFEQAETHLAMAQRCYKRINKVRAWAGTYISYAVLYNLAGNYRQALQAVHEAEASLAAFQPFPVWMKALIHQALGEAYLGLGQLIEAENHVRMVMATKEADILPDAYRLSGEILCCKGELSEAEQFARQSIKLAEENGDSYLAGFAWRTLAEIYRAQNQAELMTNAAATAIALFTEINLPNEVDKTTCLLASDAQCPHERL